MQEAGNTALAAAVDGYRRQTRPLLEIDWRQDGAWRDHSDLIKSAQIHRELSSTLPSAISLIEGFATSKLSLDLVGKMRPFTTVPHQFTSSADGWAASGPLPPAVNASTVHAFEGTHSLHIAWQTGGVLDGIVQRDFTGLPVGVKLRASVRARVPTGSMPVLAVIAGGNLGFSTTVTDHWQEIWVEWVSTSSTHLFQIWPANPPTSGQVVWIDVPYIASAEEVHVSDAISPYNIAGPNYENAGLEANVRYSIVEPTDQGPVTLRQFTGKIRDITIDWATNAVDLEALDASEQLRTPLTLPLHGLPESLFVDPSSDPPWHTNTHWMVDYILRRNGINQSPPMSSEAVISATLHGGFPPEMGYGGWAAGKTHGYKGDAWVAGQYGLALYGGPEIELSITYTAPVAMGLNPSGNRWAWGGWLKMGGSNKLRSNQTEADLIWFKRSSNSGLKLRMTNDGRFKLQVISGGTVIATHTSPTLALGAVPIWRFIGFQFCPTGTGSTVNWRFEDVAWGNTTQAHATIVDALPGHVEMTAYAICPMQCLQFLKRPNSGEPDWWGDAFTPEAVIDRGLNEVTSLPLRADVDSWTLIKEVVAAEFGTVGFDEFGVPFFRNRNTVRAGVLTTEKQLAEDTNLKGLRLSTTIDSVRDMITWKSSRRLVDDVSPEKAYLFQSGSPDQFVTPPGGRVFLVTLPDNTARIDADGDMPQYTSAAWTANNPRHGFVAVQHDNPAVEISSGITVAMQRLGHRLVKIYVYNHTALVVALANTSNSAAFRIGGYLFEDEPTVQSYQSDDGGSRLYNLGGSDWWQEDHCVREIARSLLQDTKQPIPVLDEFSIVGDPRLQLNDTLRMPAPGGRQIRASVQRISRSFQRQSGLTDQLRVRAIGPINRWVLGDAEHGVLGSTTRL